MNHTDVEQKCSLCIGNGSEDVLTSGPGDPVMSEGAFSRGR